MTAEWEVFKRSPTRSWVPSVTIGKTGLLLISRAAWDLIDHAATVDLMFDPKQRVIGLCPSEAATAFRVSGHATTRTISGRAFLRYYDIAWRSMRFSASLRNDVLCIDVSNPGTKVS